MVREVGNLWEEGFHIKEMLILPIKKICHRPQRQLVIDSFISFYVHKRQIYCDREQIDCLGLGVVGNNWRQRNSMGWLFGLMKLFFIRTVVVDTRFYKIFKVHKRVHHKIDFNDSKLLKNIKKRERKKSSVCWFKRVDSQCGRLRVTVKK